MWVISAALGLVAATVFAAEHGDVDDLTSFTRSEIREAPREVFWGGGITYEISSALTDSPEQAKKLLDTWLQEAERRLSEDPDRANQWRVKGYVHYRIAVTPTKVYANENPDAPREERRQYLVNHPFYKEHVARADQCYQRALEIEFSSDQRILDYGNLSAMTGSQSGQSIDTRLKAARYLVDNDILKPTPEEIETDHAPDSEQEKRYDNYSRLVGALVTAQRYDEALARLDEMKALARENKIWAPGANDMQEMLDESIGRVRDEQAEYRERQAEESRRQAEAAADSAAEESQEQDVNNDNMDAAERTDGEGAAERDGQGAPETEDPQRVDVVDSRWRWGSALLGLVVLVAALGWKRRAGRSRG